MATALQPQQTEIGIETGRPAPAAAETPAGSGSLPPAPGVLRQVRLDLIDPSPYQPRVEFTEADLADLTASMGASGLLQPITVRRLDRTPGGRYELIAGERRLRAAGRLGWPTIEAVVRSYTDEQAMDLALIENLQRADLSPLDEGRAYARHMRERGMSQQQVADLVKKPRSTVQARLGLLAIGLWTERLAAGEITVSQAVELYRYRAADEATHEAALRAIRERAWDASTSDTGAIAAMEVVDFRRVAAEVYGALDAGRFPPRASAQPPAADPLPGTRPLPDRAPAPAPIPAPPQETPHEPRGEATCIHCGCTDSEACAGGCCWTVIDEARQLGVCSACTPDVAVAKQELAALGNRPEDSMPAPDEVPPDVTASATAEARAARTRPETTAAPTQAAAPITTSSPRRPGMFTVLAPLVAERAVTITLAPGATPGTLRVNIIPKVLGSSAKPENRALSMPLTVDATPEDLDEQLADAIAEFLAKRDGVREGVERATRDIQAASDSAATVATAVKDSAAAKAAPNAAPVTAGAKPGAKGARKPKPRAQAANGDRTRTRRTATTKAAAEPPATEPTEPTNDPAQLDIVDAAEQAAPATTTDGEE